jgi:hypothetical protein
MDWTFHLRAIERLVVVVGGILSLYLGYALFVKGVSGKASLKVEYDKSKLQLANAAPGIFFGLLGAFILVFTMWKAPALDYVIHNPGKAAETPVQPDGVGTSASISSPTIDALPISRAEAEKILDVLEKDSPSNIKLIRADPHSKEGGKNDEYIIVRFATHGTLAKSKPDLANPSSGVNSAPQK